MRPITGMIRKWWNSAGIDESMFNKQLKVKAIFQKYLVDNNKYRMMKYDVYMNKNYPNVGAKNYRLFGQSWWETGKRRHQLAKMQAYESHLTSVHLCILIGECSKMLVRPLNLVPKSGSISFAKLYNNVLHAKNESQSSDSVCGKFSLKPLKGINGQTSGERKIGRGEKALTLLWRV